MKVTNEQNIALVAKYREAKGQGDTAAARRIAEALVTLNEGLVKQFGMRFGRPQTADEKHDVFQAARMGVLRALEDFDPAKGAFSTHAQWHIRDYVQRFSGKPTAVSRPRSAQMPARVAKAMREFRQRYGREPSAEELGVDARRLAEWSSATHFVELDGPSDDERHFELTYDAQEAEHATRCLELDAAWEEELGKLSPRNREICDRVLMKGEDAKTVGQSFGLTHGRVLQVCKRIETRLRRALNPENYNPDEDWEEQTRARCREAMRRRRSSPPLEQSA